MHQEPQTTRERAVLLLSATFLPGWRPTPSQGLVWAIRGAIVLGVFILIASVVDKTLWDWLGLLIVPAVLAIGGYLFTGSQNRATQAAARNRTQDEALQAYLNEMAQMLLDKDRPLRQSKERDEVRILARARTLTVLPRLDGSRKGTIVRFLYEAGLIVEYNAGIDPTALHNPTVLDLRAADLSRVDVNSGNWLDLTSISLGGANLREAILPYLRLHGAYLREADLRGADLRRADLNGAYMVGADLRGANLSKANLHDISLIHHRVDPNPLMLIGAENIFWDELPPGEFERRRELLGVLDIVETTNLLLEYMADSLEGATMPDGQQYEDWIADSRTQDLLMRVKKIQRNDITPS